MLEEAIAKKLIPIGFFWTFAALVYSFAIHFDGIPPEVNKFVTCLIYLPPMLFSGLVVFTAFIDVIWGDRELF